MRLARVEPGNVLTWSSEDGNWVWTFTLEEYDGTSIGYAGEAEAIPSE